SEPPRLARAHPGTGVAAWCFWPLAGISGGAGPDDRQSYVGFDEKLSRQFFCRPGKQQRVGVAELPILFSARLRLVKSFHELLLLKEFAASPIIRLDSIRDVPQGIRKEYNAGAAGSRK